ncbi:DUF6705 family protein [Aquimarina algiphila]|uniref:DUF6705 family protein n=1 Tax=Aquimarina algiphila TaxID=2047982 RepID=UPI002330A8E7|nr:DUF6705 family protein [Aquimarina algiphila]
MSKVLIFKSISWVTIISCSAQVIPVEKHQYYIDNQIDFSSTTYFKDVNGVLDKFVGTWKGTVNSKNYELRFFKNTLSYKGFKKDEILGRYKITSSNGTVIENTLSLQKDNPLILASGYVDPKNTKGYVFYYLGREDNCGQNGELFTYIYENDNNKMQMVLVVSGENLDCTGAFAQQVFPVNFMDLTKQ